MGAVISAGFIWNSLFENDECWQQLAHLAREMWHLRCVCIHVHYKGLCLKCSGALIREITQFWTKSSYKILPWLPNAALWKEQWYEFLMRFFSHENVWLHLMIMLCNLTLDTCNNVHQTQKIRGVKDVKCPPLNAMKTNLNVVNFLGDSVIVWISWYKSIMFFRFVSKTDKVLKVSQHGYFYIN